MSLPKLLAVLGAVAAFQNPTPPALASQVRCGDVITQDTRLEADLVNCPGDGIVIGADHVALDLNGHVIDGGRIYLESMATHDQRILTTDGGGFAPVALPGKSAGNACTR